MGSEDNLKIIGIQVNGLRKLKAINLQFNKNGLTQIIGANRMGKTTLAIDAIQILIRGNKYANKDIVAHDKPKATLVGTVGDYKITRVIPKEGTPTLKVVDTRTNQPLTGRVQDFLDTFINELTFNPQPFLKLNRAEKLKFMMDLCKIDFSKENSEISTLYDQRKLLGQEIDRYGEILVPKKVLRIDVTEIVNKKKRIAEDNQQIQKDYEIERQKELHQIEAFNKEQRDKQEKIKANELLLSNLNNTAKEQEFEIEELEDKLKELKNKLAQNKDSIKNQTKFIASLPKPEAEKPLVATITAPELQSTDDLDKQLATAAETNQKAIEYETQLNKLNEKTAKEAEYKEYNEKIESIRKQKLEKLAKAKTGVEGLKITEDDILYKGTSSENWSDSEGLSISRQLCIAQKPKLNAVFLDRAESMDKKTLKEFVDWAVLEGIQAIITKVVDERPATKEDGVFYIEDGSIVEEDEE